MGKKKNRRAITQVRRGKKNRRDSRRENTSPEAIRYRRIKLILEEALERTGTDRESFLKEACSGDQALRAEVDSLLGVEEPADRFIAEPIVPRHEEGELPESSQVGPYRLLKVLGRGGMGVVYLAERQEEFEQRVAIKLIKRGMDSDEILGRFRHERQILAGLTHPNIAQLHDGGTSESGQPYFVMEFVDGQPLREYAEENLKTLDDRLALFLDVCRAVGFAHQNLVVHRDLKPANILVTAEGVPKLVDFGIAKLLGPSSGAPETRLLRPFTREYASPEQLEKGVITTKTDVYSLGVILYELLTGQRPYQSKESSTEALLTAAREQVLTKPSNMVRRQTSSQESGANRRLPPVNGPIPSDLDAIVLKALRYEDDLRYSSVDRLMADLECYRNGLPVEARQGSTMYRATKFVRRNAARLLFFFAVLILAGVLALAELRRLELDRQSRVSQALGKYVVEIFQEADTSSSGRINPAWKKMLDQAADHIDQFLEEDPLIKSAFLGSMGQVYRRSGELDKAEELLEECLRIRIEELSEDHGLVATSLYNLSTLRRDQGRLEEAEELLQRTIVIDQKTAKGKGSKNLATSLNNLAGIARELGRFDDAVATYRQALAMKERLFDAKELDTRDLAMAHSSLARSLISRGDLDEAEEHYQWALDALSQNRAKGDEESLAQVLTRFGSLLRDRGELTEAHWRLLEGLDIRKRLYENGLNPKLVDSKREVARLIWAEGKLDDAWTSLQEVMELQTQIYGAKHPEVGVTFLDLARLEAEMERPRDALESGRAAAEIFAVTFPSDHWRVEESKALVAELSPISVDLESGPEDR